MLLGTVSKQPRDRIDFDVTFGDWLDERGGDTIGAVLASVAPAGLTLLTTANDGRRVKQWIEGGESGTTYQITLTATTVGGRQKEVEIRVRVRER